MIRSFGVSSRWRILVSLAVLACLRASNFHWMVRAEMQASWTPNEEERTALPMSMNQRQQLLQHDLDVLHLLHVSQHTQTSFDLLHILGIKILDEILLCLFVCVRGFKIFLRRTLSLVSRKISIFFFENNL